MTRLLPLLANTACILPIVDAWGAVGHETVALIAQNYVSSATVTWAQKILGSTSSTYMADVSTWADSYRSTSAGKFSAPYHYIDAQDSPPSSCGVDYQRDCGSSGCSVSAIANYTSRVKSTSPTTQLDALRFLIHFLGDLHQPLHDEAIQTGGNGISVLFNGTTTNLHAIWDTQMPQKINGGGSTLATAQSYAQTLIAQINSGTYKTQTTSWLSGTNVNDPVGTTTKWANDANQYVCSVVMPQGASYYSGKELSGAYYSGCVGTINLQIAKAGYRLAAWLDLIATGKTGLGGGVVARSLKRDAEADAEAIWWELPGGENDASFAKREREAHGWLCKH